MYNDCWPALGYALVDFYGVPKAGWYATKHSGASVAATIKPNNGRLEFIALNHGFNEGAYEYKVKLYQASATKLNEVNHGRFTLKSNTNELLLAVDESAFEPDGNKNIIVFLELYKDGQLISRGRWYPDWLKTLNLPKAEIEVTVDREAKNVTISCKSGVAIGVALDGDAVFEDNYIDLLQGETKVVSYNPLDGFDKIDVYGYNVDIINGI